MEPFNIVLVEPEIPQNTGNIARLCAVTGARLHLVRPLGFEITDAKLKRAGLDYWHMLDLTYYDDLNDFMAQHRGKPMYFASSKAKRAHSDITYPEGAFFLFGKETHGLPESLIKDNYENAIRIPMLEGARCLNLSNSASVVLYEALRQTGYAGLSSDGELTGRLD